MVGYQNCPITISKFSLCSGGFSSTVGSQIRTVGGKCEIYCGGGQKNNDKKDWVSTFVRQDFGHKRHKLKYSGKFLKDTVQEFLLDPFASNTIYLYLKYSPRPIKYRQKCNSRLQNVFFLKIRFFLLKDLLDVFTSCMTCVSSRVSFRVFTWMTSKFGNKQFKTQTKTRAKFHTVLVNFMVFIVGFIKNR